MSRQRTLVPTALGFRALKGGAVAVGVAVDGAEPRIVLSAFLATAADGDRLSLEPYGLAAAMKRGPGGKASAEAAAAVAEGRERQERFAVAGLDDIVGRLAQAGCAPVVAALLVNRCGWITDLLAYGLSGPEHAAVAEGLAVREALRVAFRRQALRVAELDEKSLREKASSDLDLPGAEIDALLQKLGASAGRPWRKEQKLACLGAWITLAAMGTKA